MTIRMTSPITPLVLVLAAGSAAAQSWNIDLSAIGQAAPAAAFGAAAGTPGTWNNINGTHAQTVSLINTSGAATGVTLKRTPFDTSSFTVASDFDLSGSTGALMLDGQSVSAGITYQISNLPSGRYAIYVYAGRPGTGAQCTVSAGALSPIQDVGGNPTSNDMFSGTSYSVHMFDIPNASTRINIEIDTDTAPAYCAGIQIKRVGDYLAGDARFFVDDSSPGPQDGGSWATAFHDVQTALDAARKTNATLCQVWVAQGFYEPTSTTDRAATFSIPSGLEIYGGFSAVESTLEERQDPWFHITALVGSIGGSSQSDNSYNVVTINNASNKTIVDGFTIARGQATGSGPQLRGGGLHMENSSPLLANIKFISNHAALDGGGVSSTGGSPKLVNCLFFDNSSDSSGAGFHHYTSGTPTIHNTQFLSNSATGDGGAMKISFTQAHVHNCLFSGNNAQAGVGGAISLAGDSADSVFIGTSTFSRNSAVSGGAIYINNDTDCYLRNSILWGNTASSGGSSATQQRAWNGSAQFLTSYTTVQGLDPDPLFVDADGADNIPGNSDDNCRLKPGSPCIDAGNDGLLTTDDFDLDDDGITIEALDRDLDLLDRTRDDPFTTNTGGPFSYSDRGCYEFQPHCRPDWNQDGTLDAFDYDDFVSAYFSYVNSGTGSPDYNADGSVDAFDYDDFVSDYFSGC